MENTSELKELISPYLGSLGFEKIEFDEENLVLRFESKSENGLIRHLSFGSIPLAYYISETVNTHLSQIVSKRDKLTIKNHLIEEELMQSESKMFGRLPFKTKADKEACLAKLKQHVEDYILPFFGLYPDLKTFHDEVLDKIPFEDRLKYIPGKCNLKSLIIFKLFNNPKLESLAQHVIDGCDKAKLERPDWSYIFEADKKNYLKAMEYFESTDFKGVGMK